ncbi:helix-turn-helix domain-containing protein [Streptomyces sp. NBC_00859]|uniref:helix-turn-helix domain-containing protein n=1 Tax=Streptomyces sp. NBC_00859 TaxID=2903682 RepID=UPI0038652673|nr:helix-turn-helix domain-containing protein [Streptomyces sp. NBC_00859]
MTLSTQETAALRTLLESRRAAIAPETVGYTERSGAGRPVNGLSQEQIDALTHRARGTYGRLINGPEHRPNPAYLGDLARLLRMTEQEWTTLYWLTRREVPAPLHNTSGMEVPGAWKAVELIHGVMAYLVDSAWNLITCNKEYRELFPGGEAPQNALMFMAVHPERHSVLLDWERSWAPFVLGQLRRATQERPDNKDLARIEEYVLHDPVAGPLYEATPFLALPFPDGAQRPVCHPQLGEGMVSISAAEPVTSPGSRLMLLTFRPGPPGEHRRNADLRAAHNLIDLLDT